MRALIGLLGIFVATPSVASERDVVAVFEIERRGIRMRPSQARRLSQYVATLLAASGRHQIVPTDTVRRSLNKAKAATYRECYDEGCQIEVGRELAASKILSTEISRVGASCIVTMRLYDLTTAASDGAATAKSHCDTNAIVGALERAVGRLTGRTTPTLATRSLTVPITDPTPKPKSLPKLRATLPPRPRTLPGPTEEDRLARRVLERRAVGRSDPKTSFAIAMLSARDEADRPRAIAAFEKILREAPNYPRTAEVLFELGHLYAADDRPARALKPWRRLVHRHPKSRFEADAYFWIARMHDRTGRPKAAIDAYARVRSGPNAHRARYREAWANYRAGRPHRAERLLRKLRGATSPDLRDAAALDRARILDVLR